MTLKVRKNHTIYSVWGTFQHLNGLIRFDSVTSTNPHKFSITIRTEEYDAETESNGLACQLVFTYTEKYPDTAPLVEIENAVNFEDDFEEKLLEHINETVCSLLFCFYLFLFGFISFRAIGQSQCELLTF